MDVKIKKKEIETEVSLKKRIELICDFAKVKPKFINSNVINNLKVNKLNKNNYTISSEEVEQIKDYIEHTKNTTSNLKDTNDLNDIFDKNDIEVIENRKFIEKSDDFER